MIDLVLIEYRITVFFKISYFVVVMLMLYTLFIYFCQSRKNFFVIYFWFAVVCRINIFFNSLAATYFLLRCLFVYIKKGPCRRHILLTDSFFFFKGE